jgi:hypothetical protein
MSDKVRRLILDAQNAHVTKGHCLRRVNAAVVTCSCGARWEAGNAAKVAP